MIIWDRKTLKPELTTGEFPQTIYGLSPKGWMDMELFELWFIGLFLRTIPTARPVLLLLDGHSSHYSPAAIKMAAEEQVILFALPPNTTHLSQPLDKGVFGPLKMHWKRVCHNFMSENPGQVPNRYVFSRLFHRAWVDAMTPKNIVGGFKTTGVHPLDRNAIVLPGEEKKKMTLSEKTGVPYIPLFTPSKRHRESVSPNKCPDSDSLLSLDSEYDFASPTASPLLIKSDLRKLLDFPSLPPSKQASVELDKAGARVLTSSENLKQIEEKEMAKQEKKKPSKSEK